MRHSLDASMRCQYIHWPSHREESDPDLREQFLWFNRISLNAIYTQDVLPHIQYSCDLIGNVWRCVGIGELDTMTSLLFSRYTDQCKCWPNHWEESYWPYCQQYQLRSVCVGMLS